MKKDNLIHDIVNIEIDKSKILDDILNYKEFKSKKKFAEFLGINPNTLSNWYSRNTFDENLIIGKIPELNEVWLLTGKGEMLKTNINNTQRVVGNGNVVAGVNSKIISSGNSQEAQMNELKQEVKELKQILREKDEQINKLINILSNGR